MPGVELIYQVRQFAQWDILESGQGKDVDIESHNLSV